MRPNRGAPRPPRVRALRTWCCTSLLAGIVSLGATWAAVDAIELVEPRVLPLDAPDFVEPVALAAHPLGRLYLCDAGRGTVVSVDDQARIEFEFESPSTLPGLSPVDLAVTGFQVFVIDALSNSLLRFSDRGSYLDVLRSFTEDRLETPRAVSVDEVGRVLLADPARHRVVVLDETQTAETAVGGFGTRAGELAAPGGVAFTRGGAFFVADTGNARIQLFSGVGNWEATLPQELQEPRGVVVDGAGVLYVADAGGAVHAFADGGREHAVLEWPDAQPLDVAVHGETLWLLTRDPAALVRVRIVRGE